MSRLKSFWRPTNGRVRLGVGLLMAALFCIQCTRSSHAFRSTNGLVTDSVGPASASQLEEMARKDPAGLLRRGMEHHRQSYHDYTLTFIKQEQLPGQLSPGAEQWMEAKFLDAPFSVALKWTKNAPIGDQVLYVEGKCNNQMLVKPKGFLNKLVGTQLREPAGEEAMANTLRPVTLFGFERMMQSLLEVYERAAQAGDLTHRFLGYKDVGGRQVMVLERVLPPNKGYPAKSTVWYFDPQWMVPLGMEAADWNDQVFARYLYKDVKFNVGLTPADFTPEANGIKPPK